MGHKTIYGIPEKNVFSGKNLTKIKVRHAVFSPQSHADLLIPTSAMQKIVLKILKVVAIITHPDIKNCSSTTFTPHEYKAPSGFANIKSYCC